LDVPVSFSEIREKKSVTLEIQNCFKKKREKTCSEEEEKLKNARQRDRFGGGFIPAFREIQDHLMCVCIVTCSRARKEDGRKALLLNIKCVFLSVVFFVFFCSPKRSKPRIELRAKKGNFYDETMAADNEKEEEIEDEEVRFS
jgi:hypothetical protein